MNRDILSALFISMKISLGAVFIGVILGIFLGWKMGRTDTLKKKILEVVITLPIFFPPSGVGYILLILLGKRGIVGGYLYKYFHLNIIFTPLGGVIATTVVILPIIYQSIKNGLLGLDIMYIEVSRELGLTPWQTLIYVQLPLIKKHIYTGIV